MAIWQKFAIFADGFKWSREYTNTHDLHFKELVLSLEGWDFVRMAAGSGT
jgi:hypothetical protein